TGNSIVLTAQGQEVVRNIGMPARTGVPMANNGGVTPTNPVDAAQTWTPPGTGPTVTCNDGVATVTWPAVSATGYHVFLGSVASPYPAPLPGAQGTLPGAPVGSTVTWTHQFGTPGSGMGGSQTYTFTSYNDDGVNPITDSDPKAVLVSCAAIQPTINAQPDGWWCPTFTTVGFSWVMSRDTSVTGYAVYQAPNILKQVVLGSSTTTTTFGLAPGDDDKDYFIKAMSGGSPTGLASATVHVKCAAGTGLLGHYYTYPP